jgi:hypothetical protein
MTWRQAFEPVRDLSREVRAILKILYFGRGEVSKTLALLPEDYVDALRLSGYANIADTLQRLQVVNAKAIAEYRSLPETSRRRQHADEDGVEMLWPLRYWRLWQTVVVPFVEEKVR